MTHRVDPRVDYAFKKLLGSPENEDLLVDLLNSVLKLAQPVTRVELLNPFNERDYGDDKLSVVDVKAVDALGSRFQVEIQLQAHPALAQRILYTWARVYMEQLTSGQKYQHLRPTYAIWLLDDVLLQGADHHHHCFGLHDPERGTTLSDHLAIHLIELPKWRAAAQAMTPEDRWIYFFKHAGEWDELPPSLDNPTMRKAMDVLKNISQRERDMARYESRMDQLRVRRIYEEQAERLAELEVEVERKSSELEKTSSELQQTSSELQQASSELQQASSELQQASSELEKTSSELQQASSELEKTSSELQQASSELEKTSSEVQRLRERLIAAGLDPDA